MTDQLAVCDDELKALKKTINELSLEIQESGAVSERICQSYAILKAHQNKLLKEVFDLLNYIEDKPLLDDTLSGKVDSVKQLVLADIGKHNVMH